MDRTTEHSYAGGQPAHPPPLGWKPAKGDYWPLVIGGRTGVPFDEPTRGIDVGAKSEIYALLQELAAQGAAVIVVSSELPEVLGVSDRIAVMRGGAIVDILNRGHANEESVLRLALPQENSTPHEYRHPEPALTPRILRPPRSRRHAGRAGDSRARLRAEHRKLPLVGKPARTRAVGLNDWDGRVHDAFLPRGR
jgi:hypothetical protein